MSGYEELGVGGVRQGDVLAGKYRVERVLGVGGMGVVVAAHHIQLDEKVALKFLVADALTNRDAVSRFEREARAAVKIKSEHVARIIDVGVLENGAPYMVMEYLDGGDLSAWLQQRGALAGELAVDFILQACEAIAEAHAIGIVHRDLKPANLFCIRRADGRLSIKVLDFGISKVTSPGASSPDMTRTTAVMGSPFYMSPEQMQSSKGVDARTDIWSLGVILFELLTGRVPFHAEAVTELAVKIVTEPAPPVRSLRADLPPGLDQIVARCLEKDRNRRFQNVAELAIALRDYASRNGRSSVERILGTLRGVQGVEQLAVPPSGAYHAVAAPVPAPAPAPTPGSASGIGRTSAGWGATGPRARTSSNVPLIVGAVAVGLLLLAGGGVGIGLVFARRAATQTATSAPSAAAPIATTAAAAETARAPAADPAPPATGQASAPPPDPTPSASASSSATAPATAATHAPPHAPAATGTVAPPPATTVAPPPKANCSPPYTIDSAGHKQYKPECL